MSSEKLTRRKFVRLNLYGGAYVASGGMAALACNRRRGRQTSTKVIVLGLDGMDPRMTRRLMRSGQMPNFARVAADGHFGPLATSTPPQSPVAWASFIAGCNPGGHGIFDFTHRDPKTYLPYLSTSRVEGATRTVSVGDYVFPLAGGGVEDLRRGKAFWEVLEEHDIPATVFKMPANFPPSPTGQRTFSGLGTPDILGTYGMFSFFTDDPMVLNPDLGGGRVHQVWLEEDTFRAELLGPHNTFRKGAPDSTVPFSVFRDPERPVVRIDIGGESVVLTEGEWSPWVKVAFDMIPTQSVHGICRFYLKQVRPFFKLYVSPINIDPSAPALPISTPDGWAKELAERFGPFHTKGLPADTKALDHGVLDEGEFLAQDEMNLEERLAIFDYELDRFDSGLLFFYVSSIDQRSHMFWRLQDPDHPAYDSALAARYGDTLERSYRQMDDVLARALAAADDDTVVVALSDHGFHPYYRSFHVNSWLVENGYMHLKDERRRGEVELLQNVDWSRTRAYGIGFNGLCVNLAGREGQGVVPVEEQQALVEEIATRLEAQRDPLTGERVVHDAARSRQCYRGPHVDLAPDIVIGYDVGYRSSWQTALGKVPRELLETNDSKWSGDHLMSAALSPGILLMNRPARETKASLPDVTATVLDALDVPLPETMEGRSVL